MSTTSKEPDENDWDTFRLVCLQMGLQTTIDQVIKCHSLICPDCCIYVHRFDKAKHDERLALFVEEQLERNYAHLDFDSLYRKQNQLCASDADDAICVYVFSPTGFYIRYM